MQAMGGRGQDSKVNLRAVGRLGVPKGVPPGPVVKAFRRFREDR